ncbi:MAG: 16S rRNA (uracil(1498)-N(3))-methyltransferase [Thermoleophilia bacterium]
MRHVFRYAVADDPGTGGEIALAPEDAHHLTRVVRRGAGDPVELIGPDGRIWPAVVVAAGPAATARATGEPREPAPPRVALYQGLAEWNRIDVVVEKAVELGVGPVTLFASERARRVPDDDAWARRRERMDRVAAAAARQAGTAGVGRVRGLLAFDAVVAGIPAGEGFLIDPRGELTLPTAVADGGTSARVSLIVGPDAGFSEAEVARARDAGLAVCRLGPTILRAETAAVAAMAIACAPGWEDHR